MAGVTTIRRVAAIVLAFLMAGGLAGCVTPGDTATAVPQGAHAYSQAELDQMLAPVALYPDSLLSQLLMASTYPLEVVEAARWSDAHPDSRGDDAVRAVSSRNWDPSVKSLVAFPHILKTMNQNLQWTENLGNAFLAQQDQVMATVQKLRRKAYDAGTLKSNREITVVVSGGYISIDYASADVVYVPYYDPSVVFGVWWWPDYPPMFWGPWPGYYVSAGFGWGSATYVSSGFFFGGCDWRRGRVNVVNVRNFYYAPGAMRPFGAARYVNTAPGAWRHNPMHRRGVPYPDARLSRQFGQPYGRGGLQRGGVQYQQRGYRLPGGGGGGRGWGGGGGGRGWGGDGRGWGGDGRGWGGDGRGWGGDGRGWGGDGGGRGWGGDGGGRGWGGGGGGGRGRFH